MFSRRDLLRQEYVARINRVMDYVFANLDGDLGLERLAREAGFSAYHFHRLFRAMVGETLSGFIRRVRLERAAAMLINNPFKAVTAIALDCGFGSSAAFARAFRERFGRSASDYRKHGKAQSKRGKAERKPGKAAAGGEQYNRVMKEHKKKLAMKVEVKQMPEMHVAYVRNTGPYNTIGRAFERLMKWAGPRGLAQQPGVRVLGVYNDDPDVTEADKLRADACVTVPKGTPVSGELGLRTIPGGLYAVARFEVKPDEFGAAWNQLLGEWLPESGYQPDDRPCYEVYLNNPHNPPQEHFVIDVCEPVRPL